jgi:hypothetical protein
MYQWQWNPFQQRHASDDDSQTSCFVTWHKFIWQLSKHQAKYLNQGLKWSWLIAEYKIWMCDIKNTLFASNHLVEHCEFNDKTENFMKLMEISRNFCERRLTNPSLIHLNSWPMKNGWQNPVHTHRSGAFRWNCWSDNGVPQEFRRSFGVFPEFFRSQIGSEALKKVGFWTTDLWECFLHRAVLYLILY